MVKGLEVRGSLTHSTHLFRFIYKSPNRTHHSSKGNVRCFLFHRVSGWWETIIHFELKETVNVNRISEERWQLETYVSFYSTALYEASQSPDGNKMFQIRLQRIGRFFEGKIEISGCSRTWFWHPISVKDRIAVFMGPRWSDRKVSQDHHPLIQSNTIISICLLVKNVLSNKSSGSFFAQSTLY